MCAYSYVITEEDLEDRIQQGIETEKRYYKDSMIERHRNH